MIFVVINRSKNVPKTGVVLVHDSVNHRDITFSCHR